MEVKRFPLPITGSHLLIGLRLLCSPFEIPFRFCPAPKVEDHRATDTEHFMRGPQQAASRTSRLPPKSGSRHVVPKSGIIHSSGVNRTALTSCAVFRARVDAIVAKQSGKIMKDAFVGGPITDPDTGLVYDGIPSWADDGVTDEGDGDDELWDLRSQAEDYLNDNCSPE
jgi:hypothetical protein